MKIKEINVHTISRVKVLSHFQKNLNVQNYILGNIRFLYASLTFNLLWFIFISLFFLKIIYITLTYFNMVTFLSIVTNNIEDITRKMLNDRL